MKDSGETKQQESLSNIKTLLLGYKVAVFLPLTLFSLLNGFTSIWQIPSFHQLFLDDLGPDHPFPAITLLVFNTRPLEIFLTFAWFIMGVMAFFPLKKARLTVTLTTGALVLALLQLITMWIGISLPMLSGTTGMASH